MNRNERKIIIGVPVLPGLPLQTEIRLDGSDSDSIGSNQFDSLSQGAPEPVLPSRGASAPPSAPAEPKWKLQHMDFIPNVIKGKNEDFERFK